MGWGSGSRLMSDVISGLQQKNIPESVRRTVYGLMIPAMESRDWDTQSECMGEDSAYDDVLRELHPDWFNDDEDDE